MNTSDYINKYFEGTLSEEEKKALHALLAKDKDLNAEFEFQKELKDTLVLNDREEIKKEIQDWDKTPEKQLFKSWQIVASLILLIGASWLLFFSSPSSNQNEKLYASNFEPYRNIVQPIVRGEHKEDLQSKAFAAYETKDYENANLYFDQILNKEPNQTISFYKANTLLQLDKTKEAIAILETNVKKSDTLQDRNLWYLALAYLKNDNTEASKKTLKQLVLQSQFKAKEATLLIKNLE
ncbi:MULTISPECIES: tetratricopeptide repeat protein [unclassified Lacinutrix]